MAGWAVALVIAASVRIGVFGLFRPAELEVRPAPGAVVMVESGGVAQELEGARSLRVRESARVSGRNGRAADFVLAVPGRIKRHFHGRLEIVAREGRLTAIVEMDRETAVESIVAAESPPGAPLEALKAQAVVARSFLIAARGRHPDFDFCDTTHCQFLRGPQAAGSAPLRAARETEGLALVYRGRVMEALYSADCGGRTRTLAEAGWAPGPYPYFAVECPVRGPATGHRLGLCQKGAAKLARGNWDFRKILAYYFPGAAAGAP